MRGGFFAFLGLGAAFAVSCSIYDPSLLLDGPGKGGGSGSTGKAGSPGTDAGSCDLLTWPAPPDPKDVIPSDHDLEGVFVMNNIDLGDSPTNLTTPPTRYRTVGLDLDGVCTTESNLKVGQTCGIPSYGNGVVDGPRGQDNALGVNIQFIRDRIADFSSDQYTKGLQEGTASNIIVHVTGYNGMPNDDEIHVETLVSARFDTYKAPNTRPEWKGTDKWPIASDSYDPKTGKAKFVDDHAYVVNGKSVVTLSRATLRFVVGLTSRAPVNMDLNLKGAVAVCDTGADETSPWKFFVKNCTLSARWEANDIIHQLSRFPDPLITSGTTPLCTDSPSYTTFKTGVCSVVDVPLDGLATPSLPCDALSMGVHFDTAPAVLGEKFDVLPIQDPCPPGRSPANDCCDCETPGIGGASGTGGKSGGTGGKGGATGSGGASSSGGTNGNTDAGQDASATDASSD